MLQLDDAETRQALDWRALIEALRDMFRDGCEMPVRHHHDFEIPGEAAGTLLLMPAWVPGRYLGMKYLTVVPGNSGRDLPTINASYLLSDGRTGEMLAMIDGGVLTERRTAAASALAADYLARPAARNLLIVGTGRLSTNLAAAHAAVRPLSRITVWGRDHDKAEAVARQISEELDIFTRAADDLEGAARSADIISCATMSHTALIKGEWLAKGCHVDLVGAFKAEMRESDDEVMRRGRVFVDTRAGAMKEGGDIVQALDSGALTEERIEADLADLAGGRFPVMRSDEDITVFKSVGAALEDLAGAILAYETVTHRGRPDDEAPTLPPIP